MDELIRKYALHNAIRYNGKANVGAVIGKVFSEKKVDDPKKLSQKVRDVISEINKMDVKDQVAELKEIAPELLEKPDTKEKKELPELPNARVGEVVTRIPPEPSKYNHIGHALSFLINYMYSKKYKGECIIRFEDTNPLKAKQEYVDAMKQDVMEYLDIKPDKIIFASDNLEKLYGYAEHLIKNQKAYVCSCPQAKMRRLRHEGVGCECREKPHEFNMRQWENMKDRKYQEGEVVLRLKGDMESENHVMRDPVIFRLVYKEHYRQGKKYCVWPMYDFENAVEDSTNGVTHILRSNEFGTMRIELQNYIKDLLKIPKQEIIHYGRFNIIGATTKGREIREKIENKEVIGWDDPRLVTLRALKRRGIDKRTYYDLVHKWGLNLSETNVDWDLIAATNRQIIDPEVNRYFFVNNPVKIKVKGAPDQIVKLPLHPDFPERGERSFSTSDVFYIARKDYDRIEDGKLIRLMDCLNFRKQGEEFVFDSVEYEKYRKKGKMIIHWLPVNHIKVNIRMPDASMMSGIGEETMKQVEEDDVIQAARFGFLRLDNKKDMTFWYTHD